MANWNFDTSPSEDNTVKWTLDTEKIFAEVRESMVAAEELAYTEAIIAVLREKGYGVWRMPSPEKIAEIEESWKKWDGRFDDE